MPAGRRKFEATEQQRRMAESLTGCGTPQEAIARIMEIDPKTLRKHFHRELACGADKANAQVANTLFKMATSGKCPAATIFWVKVRNLWIELSLAGHGAGEENRLSIAAARAVLAEASLSRPKEDDDEELITN